MSSLGAVSLLVWYGAARFERELTINIPSLAALSLAFAIPGVVLALAVGVLMSNSRPQVPPTKKLSLPMTAEEAQRDMRLSYFSGAPGMLASAVAWLVAGFVALGSSPSSAVLALFAGGMLIHPVGVLLCKAMGRSGKHSRSNPLGALAIENTGWLILCLPIVYAVAQYNILLFFPAMMFVIGGRYLTFQTLFGMRTYWVCGATLAFVSYVMAVSKSPPHVAAFVGSGIEAAFAATILFRARRTDAV